jgi:hypothetical protein
VAGVVSVASLLSNRYRHRRDIATDSPP